MRWSKSRRKKNKPPKKKKEEAFFSKTNDSTTDSVQKKEENAFFQQKSGGIKVGEPGDRHEQEADQVAAKIVDQKEGGDTSVDAGQISGVQRYMTNAKEDELGTNTMRFEKDKYIQEQAATDAKEEEPGAMVHTKEEKEQVDMQAAGEGVKEEEPGSMVSAKEEREQVDMQATIGGDKEEDSGIVNTKEEKEQVDRQIVAGEEQEEESPTTSVQTKSEGGPKTTSIGLTKKINKRKGKGRPLPEKTRSEMEKGFGVDFSEVNIHTDKESGEMNQALRAQAFTHGKDIYFDEGKFDTRSSQGKRLLAHELTHVVQQKGPEIKSKPSGEGNVQRSADQMPQDKKPDDPQEFRKGSTISCPADVRPGDIWMIDGTNMVYTVVELRPATQEDGTQCIEFITARTSGPPKEAKVGSDLHSWLTKDNNRINPVIDLMGAGGTVTGQFYRNTQ